MVILSFLDAEPRYSECLRIRKGYIFSNLFFLVFSSASSENASLLVSSYGFLLIIFILLLDYYVFSPNIFSN